MGEVIGTVSFWTTGEFVTTTARDWFWAENRPYPKVEEFLLACMSGTDTPKSILLGFARDVLLGRRKFIGSTLDGSYGLVDDDTDIQKQYANIKLVFELEDIERFLDANIRNQEYAEAREQVKEFWPDEYGWLSPTGEFFSVEWAHHQAWAFDYIDAHFSAEERRAYFKEHVRPSDGCSGDFLQARGWVLLHSPCQGIAQMTRHDTKPLTKAQKEYLYDYFMLRNRHEAANALFKEDN